MRRPRARRSDPPARRPATAGRPGSGARAWASASGRPRRCSRSPARRRTASSRSRRSTRRRSSTAARRGRSEGPRRRAGARRPAPSASTALRALGPAGRRATASASSPASAASTRRRLDDYRAHGGYRGARAARSRSGPSAVIDEVTAVEARRPRRRRVPDRPQVGRRRRASRPSPHYLVCNADESEPGTFKDRVLLEERSVRARRGDDDRRRSPPAPSAATSTSAASTRSREARVANAIAQARAAGLLGDDVLGSGFAFDIELRRGAGAYICGEETALFESIEGKRGEPRNKPPFPVEVGLFGKPTVVNNVETLVNVPLIVRDGRRRRSPRSARRARPARSCSACPATSRGPGVYEVDVRGDAAASCSSWPAASRAAGRSRRSCSAARPASSSAPTRSTRRSRSRATRAIGATLGSGVVMVFDETADLVGTLRRIAAVLPRRVVRPVRPLPGRDRPPGGAARAARRRSPDRLGRDDELALLARPRPGDARRLDLRPRPDGVVGDRERAPPARTGGPVSEQPSPPAAPDRTRSCSDPPARPTHVPDAAARRRARRRRSSSTIDGAPVTVPAGSTILDACRAAGHRHADAVLRREPHARSTSAASASSRSTGSRVLVPACSRKVEAGMEVQTDSERVRHSRKIVLELLGSSVDLSLRTGARRPRRYVERYGADPARFGPPARRPRPASATPTRPATTTRRRATPRPRPSPSRSRSTTSSTSATTRSASSATSASRPAARTPRTRSRSPSPGAASTPGSRPSATCRCPTRPASTAATASASARPAR